MFISLIYWTFNGATLLVIVLCQGAFNRPGSDYIPKGPRTQIMGFSAPNTILLMVFGP